MGEAKLKKKASEVMREGQAAKVEALEEKFGVSVDITNVTMGDLSDLTSNDVSFQDRLQIIQKMLASGNARDIRILDLQEFMDLVTTKLELQTNPT